MKLNEKCLKTPECYVEGLTQKDVQCIDNSCKCIGKKCRHISCIPRYCNCESNEYHTNQNKCTKLSKIGETCISNENCAPFNGTCTSGICSCVNKVLSDYIAPNQLGKICLKCKFN